MPSQYRAKGTRVSVTIPTGLAARLVNHPKVGAEMTSTVQEIATRADQLVPVGEATHNGVHLGDTQKTEVRITPQGVVGLITYSAYWAHFVHNGTARQPANPWLLNAALSVLVAGRVPGKRAA